MLQLGAGSDLVNGELRPSLERLAAEAGPEQTLRRVDALERTRGLLEANVPPLLAFESLMVGAEGSLARALSPRGLPLLFTGVCTLPRLFTGVRTPTRLFTGACTPTRRTRRPKRVQTQVNRVRTCRRW